MEQIRYLISDAAKQVEVESHVLRYWEEELAIPIKRNELGHRFYTQEDVDCFKEIKNLKEQGLQLKAIRMILKNGKLERLNIDKADKEWEAVKEQEIYKKQETDIPEERQTEEEQGKNYKQEAISSQNAIEEEEPRMIEIIGKRELAQERETSKEEKGMRLQILLQHMISQAVRENNKELYEDFKECILKEMDYQFRQQEEKTEELETQRRQREDEHYQKIDEMLRSCSRKGKHKENEKTLPFGTRKKPSIV